MRKYVDQIKAAGGNAVTYVYPGEGHAFMNAQSDSIERMKSGLLIKSKLSLKLHLSYCLGCIYYSEGSI